MLFAAIVLGAVTVAWGCVPTTTITTTTVACCPPLTTTTIPKVAPVSPIANFEQCSILRRISKVCPTTGTLICKAAPETNPSSVVVQAIDSTGAQIVQASGSQQAILTLFCVNGVWKTSTAGTGATVTSVSCSQTGSTGADFGNVGSDFHSGFKHDGYGGW